MHTRGIGGHPNVAGRILSSQSLQQDHDAIRPGVQSPLPSPKPFATYGVKFEAMITRSINLRGVPEHLRSLEFQINDSSAVGRTAAHRKPLLLNLISGEVSPRVGDMLNYPTRNIFSGPLITPRGDLVGVVQLLNKLPQDETPFDPYATSPLPNFDKKDERLFSVIAGQAALAIENSL